MPRTTEELLAQLKEHPDSETLHAELLEAFADEGAWEHPARYACILWLVRNAPTNMWCGTPYAHIDPALAREAYDEVRHAWLHRANDSTVSSLILRNAALFVAAGNGDRAESLALLARAAELSPDDARVWVDIGRVSLAPADRLSAFLEARRRGDRSENVRGWIATLAAAEGDLAIATSFATEMLAEVHALEAEYAEHLRGPPEGTATWPWAASLRHRRKAAYALVRAVSTYAYFTHQAHTALGVVAMKRGDASAAVAHLETSFDVRPESRLGAYGPNMTLVRELCLAGLWAAAEVPLRRWHLRSPNDEVEVWLEHLARRELPIAD